MDKFMVGLFAAAGGALACVLVFYFAEVETMKSRIVSDQIVYVGDAMYTCEEVDR